MGYEAPHDVFAVEVPVDEVVLLWDSVAVRDGELLGLVQNRSATLFAREVTVTLGDHDWVFALTVQPGEVAPFVLGAGTVSVLPERSEVEVSAALSPQPDLSRSFSGDIVHVPDAAFVALARVRGGALSGRRRTKVSSWAPMDLPLGSRRLRSTSASGDVTVWIWWSRTRIPASLR